MQKRRLQFHGWKWPQNPTTLTVHHGRQIREQKRPFASSVLQDLGEQTIQLTGEGVFRGKQAMQWYEALQQLQTVGTALLELTGLPPLMAKLTELELSEQIQPEKVGYRFTFWEDPSVPLSAQGTVSDLIYTAAKGENLWAIANQHDTTVEALLQKNPMLCWPGYLQEGQQVIL